MRLAWYAGVSTALAAGVAISAFQQRANFYSAMVYLAQSNLCLLVLINFVYIIYGFFIFGLQRLLFGPLRPSEVESLSENAWFAITETCLAMTTFRDEMGAWFLVMFTALVTGKVWGWIGDGRIEILEQQPPANPRLFHARLIGSLLISFFYDLVILQYTASSVIQQARPNMMVMFLFEFAILAACSARTLCRYGLCVVEMMVGKRQTQQRLEERRRQAREERTRILEQRAQNPDAAEGESSEPLPDENAIDEMDIEVPGWESKGQWVLFLELATDFIKLGIYTAFFFILLAFYGLPIHIMRDLFMTARSFLKSLGALLRYRKALQDLRVYPDATVEDLARDPTCIICREEMQPWNPTSGSMERYRPKKLQCGHILHLGCLKSWLERQQVCPTCRRPVAVRNEAANGGVGAGANAMFGRVRLNFGFPAEPAAQAGAPREAGAQGERDQPPPDDGGGIRVLNLGPVRVGIARGNAAANIVAAAAAGAQPDATRASSRRSRSTRAQIAEIDGRIQAEIQQLQGQHQELQVLHALNAELRRIRHWNRQNGQAQTQAQQEGQQPLPMQPQVAAAVTPGMAAPLPYMSYPVYPAYAAPPPGFPNAYPARLNTPSLFRYGSHNTGIPAGSSDLPEGVVIPPGWSLVPLSRMEGAAQHQYPPGSTPTMAEGAGTPARQPTPTPDWYGAFPHLAVPQQQPGESSTAAATQTENADAAGASSSAQPEPPQVVAPNPVAPNWGGTAQLFGSHPFASPHPSVASLETTLQPTPTSVTAEQPAAEGAGSSTQPVDEQPEALGGPSEDKGKGRAVSLEEAEDDGV